MFAILVVPLGYIMYASYRLFNNYALAIILFTLITKIVLLPISIWVHQNGIKIVKLTPELNKIKINYFGDGDRIADETQLLYKREKYNAFASLIPLFIQIALLIGLIQVIYNPLTHLLHIDNELAKALSLLVCDLTGANPESNSLQLEVVRLIQKGQFNEIFLALPNMTVEGLDQISKLNMNVLFLNLGDVPATTGGALILIPILAGAAAFVLSVCQSKMNPLQAEQSKTQQFGTMAVSVGISLFLGFSVPAGIGFYWIWSNIFTILQQVVLNVIYSPAKVIDYKSLEESKKELAELQNLGTKKKWYQKDEHAKREKEDYKKFFSIANKHLVFYSEGSGFYKYYEVLIDYLLSHSNVAIHYVTSDPNDQVFNISQNKKRMRPYYIGEKKLITLMMKMDADIVVMTMPEIENFHIKRSYVRNDIEYIYVFHWCTSTHMTIREKALDHYDTIFCTGPYQVKEIRHTEKIYQLPPKTLVETGYGVIEKLTLEYEKMDKIERTVPQILIAPSHQTDNILDSCIDDLLETLMNGQYKVIIRPHPQYIRRYPQKVEAFQLKYKKPIQEGILEYQTDFSSGDTVYQSDIVITDWSTISYEFSLTTLKPSLVINTPMKVLNPHYLEYPMKPLDILLRDRIGKSLETNELNQVERTICELLEHKDQYKEQIAAVRNDIMPTFGHSAEIGGKYILKQLKEKANKKKE